MFIWQYFTLVCLWFASNEAKSIKKSHVNLLEPTFDLDEKLGRMGIAPPDISNDVQRVQVPLGAAPGKGDWQGKWFPHVPGEPQATRESHEMSTTEGVPPLESTTKDNWQGKWFPQAPGEPHLVIKKPKDQNQSGNSTTKDNWRGKWFPHVPGEPQATRESHEMSTTEEVPPLGSTTKDNWQGKWFPQAPGEPHLISKKPMVGKKSEDTWLGKWFPQDPKEPHKTKQNICDDGKSNLAVDFDPTDIRDSLNYLCISSNRSMFQPNLTREAILTEHFLPSAYLPPAKCLNEPIGYSHLPATNGPYRPMPAEYGSYTYLPPQRYLRNLAEGAIVMLYHPCAFSGQVKQLQDILSGCLYRYLISPSQSLSPERPLALLAWSRSLEMSVVDRRLAADFIQKHAKRGPLAPEEMSRVVDKRQTYKQGLLTEAHLVTTADDYEVCGYLQEEM